MTIDRGVELFAAGGVLVEWGAGNDAGATGPRPLRSE